MKPTAKNAVPPRERILATASRLFYAQGVSATGIDQIIAEAEVAKATLYYHFKSKTEIVNAYLRERDRAWMEAFKHNLFAIRPLTLPALADALEVWFKQKTFNGCAFINIATDNPEPAWLTISRAHKAELRQLIALHCLPEIPDTSRETIASQALLVIEGMIVRYQMTRDLKVVADGRTLLGTLAQTTRRKKSVSAR